MTCLTGPETEGSDPHSRRKLDALTQLAESDPPSERTLASLCAQAADMLGARGLALAAVEEPRRPWLVTGSDPDARGLVAMQFDLEEGPCLDAWRSAEPVWDRCATAAGRWPRWTPQALDAGVDGVLSVPLGGGGAQRAPLGTMWLAFERADWLDDSLLRWVAAMAEVALRDLARHRELEQRREQVSQLEHALHSRVLIEQAKGFIAARDGVSPEEAFERLRRSARSSQRRLRDVAEEALQSMPARSA